MSTQSKLRIGPQAYIFAMMGGLFLFASLIFGVLGVVGSRSEAPPPAAIEGTVEPGALVRGPFGQQVLYGHLRIQAVRGKRYTTLHEGSIGSRSLQVRTSEGVRAVELPAYSYTTWKQDTAVYKSVQSLEGTGLEQYVKGWQGVQRDRFYVELHYVAPGQALILDTRKSSLPLVWFGTREAIAQRAQAHAALAIKMWGFVALLMIAAGGGLIALHFVMKRRLREAMPPDHSRAHLPAWVALAVRQKGGRYQTELEGRALDALSAYRKHGLGPILVTLSTPLATRLSFIRNSGARRLPSLIATDSSAVDGDAYGYPGVKITGPEPGWCGMAVQNPAVRQSVLRLMDPATHQAESVSVILRPGKLMLSLGGWQPDAVSAAGAGVWVGEMLALATALESLPPAREVLQRTRLEQLADNPQGQSRVLLLVLAVLAAFALMTMVAFIVLLG